MDKLEALITQYLATDDEDEANRLAMEVEKAADAIDYQDHGRMWAIHTQVEQKFIGRES